MNMVSVKDIVPNPFQSRKLMDPADIKLLADEIKEKGFWHGALRARRVNGKYELVFGHRRLAALKQIGVKEVEVEVIDLDDTGMAEDSLIENMQRMGLPDMDKAEAIVKLWELKSGKIFSEKDFSRGRGNGLSMQDQILNDIATRLGYTPETIHAFMRMVRMKPATKETVRKANLGRNSVALAQSIGGEPMVRKAVEAELRQKELRDISTALKGVAAPIREKVVEKILKDKAPTATKVKAWVRKEQGIRLKREPRSKVPPDLHDVLMDWVVIMKDWRKDLKAVTPYRDYIDTDPVVAEMFRKEAAGLVADLQVML